MLGLSEKFQKMIVLFIKDDAMTGPQFYAASPKDAEEAAQILNELERKIFK